MDGLSGHELKVITKYRKEERRPEIGVEIDEARSVVASKLTRDYYIENFSAEKDKFSVILLGLDEGETCERETPRGENSDSFIWAGSPPTRVSTSCSRH
ncbi:hypothetical protein M1O57_03385 [Dehalococcoidia bacterium]|nr:hypothetical protein [Dehalococcoidia bacterium]